MDVLSVLENEPVGEKSRPIKDIIIETITIHANPIAEEESVDN
ncbi:hypothetical protein PFUGPA_00676 [Plasmodium falciparum Palo Alto/Uganda]|nr:hypothetical protein PFUGPA_00676 [Plasmodium falciparum Palo Alto/Uganda]